MLKQFLNLWPFLIGYTYALVFGHYFISNISKCLYSELGMKKRPRAWHSEILGSIERIMFIVSLQIEKPEFIAIWLGLKTAGGWVHWHQEYIKIRDKEGRIIKDRSGKQKKAVGRQIFNTFLIAQALNLGFAGISWKLIDWFSECNEGGCTAQQFACVKGIATIIFCTLAFIILFEIVYYEFEKTSSPKRKLNYKVILINSIKVFFGKKKI